MGLIRWEGRACRDRQKRTRQACPSRLQSITLSCIAPLARPRKPVGGEIALNARSEPSPGRRTTGFDWSAVRSPLQPFGFSPPHRTRNGSAVTKVHERFRMFGRFRKFSSGILPLLNIPNLLNLLTMLNPKPFPTIFVLFVTARRAVSCLRQVTSPVRGKRRWSHHLRQSLKARADCDGSVAHMRDSSPPQFSWSRQRRNDHLSDRLRHLCERASFHTQCDGTIPTV